MEGPSQQDKFKTVVVEFLQYCTEMMDILSSEGKLKLGKESIEEFKQIKKLVEMLKGEDLIKKFSLNTIPYWESIRLKDKDFFNANYAKIFGDISSDKLNFLKYIFIESNEDEIKDSIWAYIHSFIKISIRYIFNLKLIEIKTDKDDKGNPKTTLRMRPAPDYDDRLKILEVGKIWQVELYPNFLLKK